MPCNLPRRVTGQQGVAHRLVKNEISYTMTLTWLRHSRIVMITLETVKVDNVDTTGNDMTSSVECSETEIR